MNVCIAGKFSAHLKFSMLSFLILLYALIGVQGKAFPSRYKRNYDANYHYIPYQEGIVQIPAGYSPENLQNYHDYMHRYLQMNGHDWSSYYSHPVLPQPIQHPDGHHKMKAKHTWHFTDPSHVPITQYTDGMHHLESVVEAPNVIEALVRKEVVNRHDAEYDTPIVVEALVRKVHGDHTDEIPVVMDSLKVKENRVNTEYGGSAIVTEPAASYYMYKPIKNLPFISSEFELPSEVDSLGKKEKPSEFEPTASYNVYKPVKEKPFSSEDFELPVVVGSLSKKDNPIMVVPAVTYDAVELPVVVGSLGRKENSIIKPVINYNTFDIPAVDPLTKNKPIKVESIASYGASELPTVVDSLSKKGKPDKVDPSASYNMHEHIKEKSISSDDFELPVVVGSLKKDNPVMIKPIVQYSVFDISMVDPLTKNKPIKVESTAPYGAFKLPTVVDSLGKKVKPDKVEAVDDYNMEKPIKEKPIKENPVASYKVVGHPLGLDFLGESEHETSAMKEKPMKEKPMKEKPMKPIKEKPIRPIKEKPIRPIKEKPIKENPVASYEGVGHPLGLDFLGEEEHETSVMEALTKKEKPIKEKPIVSYEVVDRSLGLDSLDEEEHETPVVIEALIRKENPTLHKDEEYESPVVIEALVRKHPPVYGNQKTNAEEDKMLPKDFFHPVEESILTADIEKLHIPVVESLTFKDAESNKTPKKEGISVDETHGFEEPDIDSFDENEDDGSAMGFDTSRSARSFLPVNSNIQEQERRKFKNCLTPKNESGNCMPFQVCSVSNSVTNIDELLRNVCIIDEVFIGVCCPEFPVETVRVDWEQLKPDTEMLNEEKSSQISKECGRLPSMVTGRDPWPWMASLIAKSSDKIFCGGALIAEQYVLTAAHCTIRIPRNQILVRLGRPASENRPEPDFEVVEIKRHAGYNPRTMQNDIALLKLSRRVQLGDFRRVVCLAKDEDGIEDLVGKTASLLRWKETSGEIKDVEPLAVISTQDCQSKMRTAIADSILCTEPRTDETNCNADSGAPLIIAKDEKFEVIGILTWNRNDCDERFPALFTRVSRYNRWVEKLAS